MKSIQLLKQAAHILETPGDINEQDRKDTVNDIGLFLSDQERRSGDDQTGMRVSTDGENWEYADTAHVVSRVHDAGRNGLKEFSLTMTANDMSMDIRSTIASEALAGNVRIDYEALSTFGLEGMTMTEAGENAEQK